MGSDDPSHLHPAVMGMVRIFKRLEILWW